MKKLLLSIMIIIGISFLLPINGYSWGWWDGSSIESPARRAELSSYPVEIVVQFTDDARPETFKAWLNFQDITDKFEPIDGGMMALVGPEDGLKISVKGEGTFWTNTNFLMTKIKGPRWRRDIDFSSFSVMVDAMGMIGPEGGVVEVTDPDSPIYGAKLAIPDGALDEFETITLSKGIEVDDPDLIGMPVECGPDGIYFNKEVEITIPLNEPYPSDDILALMVFNETLGIYEFAGRLVEVNGGDNNIKVNIDHFSSYSFEKLSNVVSKLDPVRDLIPLFLRLKIAVETNDCFELNAIKEEFRELKELHYDMMVNIAASYEWCNKIPYCDFSRWIELLNNASETFVKGLLQSELLRILGYKTAGVFLSNCGAFAAGIAGIIYSPCAVCYIGTSWLNPFFLQSNATYQICENTIQMIERVQESYGCSNNGLVAYYPFDGDADDASGNGNDGTEFGGITYTQGKIGQGAIFDGINDYIRVPNSPSLNFTDQISISYWVKMETYAPYYFPYHIVEKYGSWGTSQRQWDVNFGIENTPPIPVVWSTGSQPGKWYNFTMTFDGTVLKIYKDGVLSDSVNFVGTLPQTTSDIIIGEYLPAITNPPPGGDYYFDGTLDEVRIYNRALSESEIQELALLNNSMIANKYTAAVPTIDGQVGTTEWENANSYNVNFTRNDGMDSKAATLYLQHDNTWLYVGVETTTNAGWDVYLQLRFDGNNDNSLSGSSSEPHTDVQIEYPAPGAWGGYNNYQYISGTATPSTTAPAGTAKSSYSNTNVNYEYKVKISDFNAAPGSTVGFYIKNGNDGTPEHDYEFPEAGIRLNASQYTHIFIEM